jgi:hypothetical protein
MLDQEYGGTICGPVELSKPEILPLSCFDRCEVAMNTSSIPPKSARGATGAEMVGIAVFVALALGFLGFMEFKDVLIGPKAGGYVDIDAIAGEWQAAGRPWHIVFRTDKTLGMNFIGSPEQGKMEPGTFRLWSEGNVIIDMKNGRNFTATFRALTPNQFDLVDSENGAVTVFARAP